MTYVVPALASPPLTVLLFGILVASFFVVQSALI